MEHQPSPTQLTISLGSTVAERLQYVQTIKDAMTSAIMFLVENDMCDSESPAFSIYQEIYLEANHVEWKLKKL